MNSQDILMLFQRTKLLLKTIVLYVKYCLKKGLQRRSETLLDFCIQKDGMMYAEKGIVEVYQIIMNRGDECMQKKNRYRGGRIPGVKNRKPAYDAIIPNFKVYRVDKERLVKQAKDLGIKLPELLRLKLGCR